MSVTARLAYWTRRLLGIHPTIIVAIGDITVGVSDVIVNAAKATLMGGGGVDGAIHRAGGPAILNECRALRADRFPSGLPVGHAAATTAGHLPADWVIHTVGPRYSETEDRSALLRDCYINSLNLADSLGARSVSFPLISAGVYGWPKDDAYDQAMAALKSVVTANVRYVYLIFFDAATYQEATGAR